MKGHTASPTAALAGIPAGLQAQGLWCGRRQLFVRFAAEAETATMYTAAALANELGKALTRSTFHSITIGGRDPLSNTEYLRAAFKAARPALPIMLDCDGQRPEAVGELKDVVTLVQVTVEGASLGDAADMERATETLQAATACGLSHALVLVTDDRTSDPVLLRIIEKAHSASAATTMVLHPGPGATVDRDRRWTMLIERAAAVHGDIRVALRLPPPTGMR